MNKNFPRNHGLLRKGFEKNGSRGSNGHAVRTNYQSNEPNPMTSILWELAMKRMANVPASSKSDASDYKLILDFDKLKCIEFTTNRSNLWMCIICLLKHGNDRARLIINLSPNGATMVMDYQEEFECLSCRYPKKPNLANAHRIFSIVP